MKLSSLKKVSEFEIENWLKVKLDLTPYQREKLINEEVIRFSGFYFYKKPKKQKVSLLWRLTLPLYGIYFLFLVLFIPIKFIITGNWFYSQSFVDNFHSKWMRKLGL